MVHITSLSLCGLDFSCISSCDAHRFQRYAKCESIFFFYLWDFRPPFPCFPAAPGANCSIKDIETMVGNRSFLFWLWWKACWYFFSPVILVVNGASNLGGFFFLSGKNNSALKRYILCSVFCLGDLTLVHHHICAPRLRNGPVSSVGPGVGLVHGCTGLRVDPCRGCRQVDTSTRKLLEGGCDACQSLRSLLLMASKLRLHLFSLTLPCFLQRLKTSCSPSEKWHPCLDVNRGERYSVESCSRRRAEPANNKQQE